VSSIEPFEEQDAELSVVYDVVVNDEEQYSIWSTGRPIPQGWSAVGFRATKSAALDYIEKVWTDITPLSVRRAIAESSQQQAASSPP
jgi:MbtH protein